MVDQQRIMGFRPDPLPQVVMEPSDSASINAELGEIAAAVLRREKVGAISLTDNARVALAARLERAQAARWVGAVRAAGESIPTSDAPAITPDTVWSGDEHTLFELFRVGTYRVNFQAAFTRDVLSHHCGDFVLGTLQPARRNGRTHAEP